MPACSHERPERNAHCRVWDDGVPVLHVEPIPARMRQLRVVVQELEHRHPTPGSPALWTRAKQKRKFGQKGRLNVRSTAQKKKRNLKLQENIPQGNFFPITVLY